MEPVHKRPKLRVRKAAAEEQSAAPAVQTIPTGGYLWGRDEEELVDYEEAEVPATLSPMEDDVSVVGDDISAPQTANTTYLQQIMIFPLISRRLSIWWGRSARNVL